MGIAYGIPDAQRSGICGSIILGCDGCGLLEMEAFLPKVVNGAKLFIGKGWGFGGCGVFSELVQGGDIREDGDDGGLGETEGDGGLGEGAAGIFGEEAEGPGLGQGLGEPFLLAVGAMVRGVKFAGTFAVTVGENVGGVGGAGDKSDFGFCGDGKEATCGFLFEDIVGDLKGGDAAVSHNGLALFEPADIGADGGGVVADFAFLDEFFEGLEDFVLLESLHCWIVELVEVNVVGAEATQALFASVAYVVGIESMGTLFLSHEKQEEIVIVEVIADLGADDDVVSLLGEGLDQDFFTVALAIGVGGVEEGDAEFGGFLKESNGVGFVDIAPPYGGDGPEAEPDFGEGQVGPWELAMLHGRRTGRGVTESSRACLIRATASSNSSWGMTGVRSLRGTGSRRVIQDLQPPYSGRLGMV